MHIKSYKYAYLKRPEEDQGGFMRTTLNVEDKLFAKASQLSGIKGKTSLIKRGLEALIMIESGKRLAQLGGTEKKLNVLRRRRSK